MLLDRRQFLSLSASATAASAIVPVAFASAAAVSKPGSLRFVFFTDTHTQPELSAADGTAQALRKIKSLKPDFCIQGGDHCFDLINTPRERSIMLLDLYQRTEHTLDGIPVHHALGNHDVVGRGPSAHVTDSDPLYSKKAFEQRFDSKTYYSFDQKGYHFVILDSIGLLPDGGEYEGRIDETQLQWLKADLAALPAGTPIVVTSHIPLVSAVPQYVRYTPTTSTGLLVANSLDVLDIFEGHNVIAVLQGHTHINETVYWRNTPYITSGAVSGDWWKGVHLGTPEGYTVLELANGRVDWRYDTYGWHVPSAGANRYAPIEQPRHSSGDLHQNR